MSFKEIMQLPRFSCADLSPRVISSGVAGYTWEADLQMFMERELSAWALDAAWGDRAFHKTRVAKHIFESGAALGPGETFN